MVRGNGDYSEIATLIQKSIEPLISKLDGKVDRLADKVDELARDRVTRADMEKMRNEIQTSFVLRAEYEPRHESLNNRDSYLESEVKRVDSETQSEFQRLHDRLESGKQQLEDRIKQEREVELNSKDRSWIRWSQVFGVIAVVISIIGLLVELLQHIKFQ